MAGDSSLLAALRAQVRRIERPAAADHGVLPLGLDAIDRALPGGGLARGAVHEIAGAGGDAEDGALVAAFAAMILARLAGGAPVLWCRSRPDLYGPGLIGLGLDPARLVLVAAREAEILWAMEEGLHSPGLATVVGEIGVFPAVASRRLQLAAERSGVTALVLRRWRNGAAAARERARPNAAASRWRVAPLPSAPRAGEPGVGRPRWRLDLLRCRGGKPASWQVEVRDAAGALSLAAALADRPAPQEFARDWRRAG